MINDVEHLSVCANLSYYVIFDELFAYIFGSLQHWDAF